MRPVPRPPASVPLGGSLRASRASQLARPHGPLAAVDLADGRALTVEWLATGWVVTPPGDDTAALPARADPPELGASRPAGRRRRLGTGLALAGALGAAAVALATGLSGQPAPAVAGPTAPPRPASSPAVPAPGCPGAGRTRRHAPCAAGAVSAAGFAPAGAFARRGSAGTARGRCSACTACGRCSAGAAAPARAPSRTGALRLVSRVAWRSGVSNRLRSASRALER